jgi:hypothetical protein
VTSIAAADPAAEEETWLFGAFPSGVVVAACCCLPLLYALVCPRRLGQPRGGLKLAGLK